MGQLEERLVAAMMRLKDSQPGCERHMFVLPLTMMVKITVEEGENLRMLRDDAVMLMCRPDGSEA